MDIAEKNKVINRSKLSENAEQLMQKISRERRNVIKLNVAQDTAYWDLQQQLSQTQSNYEKLQANMVQTQMQHEAVSSKYQDELRLRPETLNKLSSCRQLCDVLENYTERLQLTLSRNTTDQAALYEAYQKSGEVVRDIQTKQLQERERSQQMIVSLEEKVKLTTDHNSQMLQYFSAEKQRADAELVDMKSKFEVMTLKKEELMTSRSELDRQLDQHRNELKTKQDTILNLERNIRQLVHEFTLQENDSKDKLHKLEVDLKESVAASESLKEALGNQEIFTKSVCDEGIQLKDQIAVHLEELQASNEAVKSLRMQLEESGKANSNLKIEVVAVNETKEALQKKLNEQIRLVADAEESLQVLQHKLSANEAEKLEVSNQLTAAKEEAAAAALRIQELVVGSQGLEARVEEIELASMECRRAAENKILDLTTTITSKNKELDSKASTINQMRTEMTLAMDERNHIVANLKESLKQREMEVMAAKTLEKELVKKNEVLETDVKSKDKELVNQLNIILELRSDKDRLHDEIAAMQNKMDNIQKELSVPPPRSAPRLQAEHDDDNAVMMAPEPRRNKLSQGAAKGSQRPFAVLHHAPERHEEHSLDLNFFSDNSVDDGLDPLAMNRCLAALSHGEKLMPPGPPTPAQKRRHSGARASHGAELNAAPQPKFFKTKNAKKAK